MLTFHISTDMKICQQELERLLRDAEKQLKTEFDLKRMAELQITLSGFDGNDGGANGTLASQVAAWEKRLEAHRIECFRLHCYLNALCGSRTANPVLCLYPRYFCISL